jgi:hypothetical protein
MKQSRLVLALAMLLAAIPGVRVAAAQSHPTATQPLQLSAFGGFSGVFTDFSGGKNFSLTAGGDLGFPTWHRLRPILEVRGTYPLDHGLVDAQKDILGGLRVDYLLGRRFHPYGDFLFGRGEMDYRLGYIFGDMIYETTVTNVYSPGAGFDYDLTDHFGVKVDGQLQHWGGTPNSAGHVYTAIGTAAVVYRFDFNHHRIH